MKTMNLKCENCGLKMTIQYSKNLPISEDYEAEKYLKGAMKDHKKNCKFKAKISL